MTRQKQKGQQKSQTPSGRPRSLWPVFDSLDSVASAIGCPLAIIKAAKRDGCLAFRNKRVHSGELIPWLFRKLREANELPDGFSNWGDVLNMEKAKRERVKRIKDEGTVLDFPTAEAAASEAEGFYFEQLDRGERELPPMLTGLGEMDIAKRLHSFFADLRQQSRKKFQAVTKTKETT